MKSRVAAIVPVHNGEDTIVYAINSLLKQTCAPDVILVVVNNSTDKTADLVASVSDIATLKMMVIAECPGRKAEAVNRAVQTLRDVEYVLMMDCDTVLAPTAIEAGIQELSGCPDLAAVCSRAGILPITPGASLWQRLLYAMQRLEYPLFDAERVATHGRIKVVHGMAALHRISVFGWVGGYNPRNIVEDYELTLRYKEHGWKVAIAPDMWAWTEIPLSLGRLWRQRIRWLRGGVDALREHGFNNATMNDILQHVLGNLLLLMQLWLSVFVVAGILNGERLAMHGVVVLAWVAQYAGLLYRMKYVEKPGAVEWLLRLLILPEMVYNYSQMAALWWSYYRSFSKRKTSW